MSYNLAAANWKAGKFAGAAELARQACGIGAEALELVSDDEEARKASGIQGLEEAMSKRFELVAACASKLTDQKVIYFALRGFVSCARS